MAVKVTKTTLPGIIKEQVEGTPLQLPTAEPDSTDIRVIAPNATYHGSRYVVYNQHVWMSDDAKHILVRNEITSFDGTTIEAGAGSVALLSVEHPGVIKNAEFLAAKDPWQRFCISSVTGISKIITASTQAVSDTIQGFSKGLRGAFAEQVVTFLWALVFAFCAILFTFLLFRPATDLCRSGLWSWTGYCAKYDRRFVVGKWQCRRI